VTDQNIIYLDLNCGIVKSCHHAVFDKSWYLQQTCLPAAQLLYNLGLEADSKFTLLESPLSPTPAGTIPPVIIPWPPLAPQSPVDHKPWEAPPISHFAPLPLRIADAPNMIGAKAAQLSTNNAQQSKKAIAADVVSEYLIVVSDMAMIYISPDPYGGAFEEELDLRKFDISTHHTAGLCFFENNKCILLALMAPSTPGAHVPRWRTRLRGAWLIQINGTTVSSIRDAQAIFARLASERTPTCTLLFSHPEITPNILNKGLPIMTKSDFSQFTHDQLNNRLDLIKDGLRVLRMPKYNVVESGNVLNYTTRIMKLTRGKLVNRDNWSAWQGSEYLQLDQYDAQGMFGDPVAAGDDAAIFHLVWTYVIKAQDGCKKAQCVCDGSSRSGSVQVLNETYANCVDQTSSRLFYAIAVAENLLVFGADVSNAFAEAPPPKQGFYVRPDRAFNEWWVQHKKRPPIPPGHVIPVLSAMQGHRKTCRHHPAGTWSDTHGT
jgi:hypothetical protein